MKKREKGGSLIYIILALVISVTVFSLGLKTTQTTQETQIKTENTTERTQDIDSVKKGEITENEEIYEVEEKNETETFVEKIIPNLEDVQKIKEIVESVISTQTKEEPLIKVPTSVVDTSFSPNNDGNLEKAGILYYTNIEREKENLKPLKETTLLDQAAYNKIRHMFDNQYFEHVAPVTGEDVSYWVNKAGYTFISVGENLALGGYTNEKDMVEDWMNSPGHRENIMKESYEEIGIAVGRDYYNGRLTWIGVQMFAIPISSCPTINKNLLLSIDSLKKIIEEMIKTLNSLNTSFSSLPKPTTQQEYDDYNNLINQYNELVAEQKSLNNQLGDMIKEYNSQVNAYNECLATK